MEVVRWLAAAAALGTAALMFLQRDGVRDAASALPPGAFAAAVGLHLVTLVLRSEGWRLVLAAITGERMERAA